MTLRSIATIFAIGLAATVASYSAMGAVINPQPQISLDERLQSLPANERAEVKAQAIVDSFPSKKATTNRGQYRIEITDIQEDGNAVDVYARVYRGGRQIGFGKDGTVDIERFRFVNPPVLVPDPTGEIDRSFTDPVTGEFFEQRFREDPHEAILQALEHTIKVKQQKHTEAQIVPGKVGRTTHTLYSDPNPETTTVDSDAYRFGVGTWANARDTADALNADPSAANSGVQNGLFGGQYYIRRMFHLFDSSGITDTDTIDSATISVYRTGSFTDTNNMSMVLVQVSPASDTNIVVGDYDALTLDSPDEGATRYDITGSTNNAYSDIALNSTGLGWISKTGITKLGFRGSYDVDDSSSVTGFNNMNYNMADSSGTASDPKLVVETSVGGGGGTIPETYVTPIF